MKTKKTIASLVLAASLFSQPVHAVNYQVASGDSLYLISQKYGVSTAAIKEANNMSTDTIYPGQYLYVPDKNGIVSRTYTVAGGDTLAKIAQRFNLTVEQLKRANGLSGDMIYIGQVLTLPSGNNDLSSRAQYLTLDQSQIELMARIVYGESRGEPFEGQVAVAAVILNRIFSNEFPSTVEGVIYQDLAFTAVADGQYKLTPNAQAYQAVRTVLSGYDPTNGATYYWNPATATSKWVWSREVTLKIGRHVFAR